MNTRMYMKLCSAVLAAGLWASLGFAQVGRSFVPPTTPASQPDVVPSATTSAVSPTNVDLHALKPQLEAFEGQLNRMIQQNFEMPFALLQDTKGSYLPGFGVAFHLEAN